MPASRRRRSLALSLSLVTLFAVGCGRKKPDEEKEQSKRPTEGVKPRIEPTTAPLAPVAPPPTLAPPAEPTTEPTPAPTPAAEASLDEAVRDLRLLGVVRTGTAPTAAVIGYRNEQEVFRRGDDVFEHGTVKEIGEDSVVLEQGKKQATLRIAKEAAPPPPPEEAKLVEASRVATDAPPPPVTEGVSRAEVRAAFRDFGSVLATAGAERMAIGGGHGVRLGEVGGDSFLAKLGLRAGDVLQKVNGLTISDPKSVPDLSGTADRPEVSITFTRDEVGITLARPVR